MIGGMVATLLNGINLSQCIILYLGGNILNQNDALVLNTSLGSKPLLQKLYLQWCGMTTGVVATLFANITLPLVDYLDICSGNNFNKADIDALTRLLRG